MLRGHGLAEAGMMGSAGQYPGRSRRLALGLGTHIILATGRFGSGASGGTTSTLLTIIRNRFAMSITDKTELAPAVCGLVEVHKIHVDVGPRNIPVELRMQMHERLLQCAQTRYPHLCRRERVHPGDESGAVFRVIRVQAQLMNRLRRGQHWLEHNIDGDSGRFGKGLSNLL